MPTYGYKCTECKHEFELMQKITDEPIRECEKCGGEVKKMIFPVGIAFKGSGFHINDYRRPGKSDGNGHGSSKTDAASAIDSAKKTVEKAAEKVEAAK